MRKIRYSLLFLLLAVFFSGCESWQRWTTRNKEDRLKSEFSKHVQLTKGALNDVEEAFTYFYRASKEENRFGHLSQFYLGVCYYKLNEIAAAERAFELYLEVSPEGEKVEDANAYLKKIRKILYNK